jgi:hypothetical protein
MRDARSLDEGSGNSGSLTGFLFFLVILSLLEKDCIHTDSEYPIIQSLRVQVGLLLARKCCGPGFGIPIGPTWIRGF